MTASLGFIPFFFPKDLDHSKVFSFYFSRSLASLTRGFSSEKLAQRSSGIQRGLILSFMFSQLSGLQSFLQVGNIMHLLKR